jgi:hypothetical protein
MRHSAARRSRSLPPDVALARYAASLASGSSERAGASHGKAQVHQLFANGYESERSDNKNFDS